jgi:hypothetical protein
LSVPGLEPDKPQSSAASHSSIVSDLGNAQYLADNRTSSHALSSRDSRTSAAELVIYSEGGASLQSAIGHPGIADISGQSETPAAIPEGQNLLDLSPEGQILGESIRAAQQLSQSREKLKFLPNNALDRIITKQRVLRELSHHKVAAPRDNLDFLTGEIWEVSPSSLKSQKETTRRRIFAILGLMEKIEEIMGFIDEGLYDSDLPFILSEGSRPGLLQLRRKGKHGRPIQLFDKWKPHELESFNNYQWQLTAPYFRLSTDTDRKVQHYNLEESSTILPFIEDDEVRRGTGRAEGGFGDVWRVKIHPAHHNCCEDSVYLNEACLYAA